jgi:penicillin-binding protein 2
MGGISLYRRITLVGALLVMSCTLLVANIAVHMKNGGYTQAALRQRQLTVIAGSAEGTIYDRNFTPLVNSEACYEAVVIPTQEAVAELLPHLEEITPLAEGLQTGEPFVCRVDTDSFDTQDITVLKVPIRRSDRQLAQHIIGYTSEDGGVTGLEADYDKVLRAVTDTASVTYTVDATGQVLMGIPAEVTEIENCNAGLVTTLDADIQAICEDAGSGIERGAIVVMEVETGDVLAMVSLPDYSPDALAEALEDENSPLINRCLYAYSVGSIFKLMTCAAAYEAGLTDFTAECTGSTEVSGQVFRCHDRSGHGILNMREAVTFSCNTYFVQLSVLLDPSSMKEIAQNFGFGRQIVLSSSIVSASGTLPGTEDLALPAEMANFCFGQGLLTASPLQITQMTCGIANNGNMPLARITAGYTLDGKTVENEKQPMYAKALSRKAAYFLQDMMISAINESDSSNAVPDNVFAAAKTSTAQTGRYDENGVEYCHAWITGYFPIEKPQYAVTVLVEDGGYGNDAAAPVFREIAERVTNLNTSNAF